MFSYTTLRRICAGAAGLLSGICTYLYLSGVVPFLAYLLMLDLYLWCGIVACVSIDKNKENSLIRLMQECKMAEFIEKYSRKHANDSKKGFFPGVAILLATAYMHLGDLETSLAMFQSIDPGNPQKARKKALATAVSQCAVYHGNLSALYLRRHEVENAKLHMQKAQEYLKQLRELPPDKKGKNKLDIAILSRSLTNRELELGLELDVELNYTEEIGRLKQCFDEAGEVGTVLNRVYYQWLLYILYGKTGNTDELQKCREYVREYGGDTCYVRWVEE